MNKELNTQIEEMLSYFNEKQSTIKAEIDNLSKSTKAIEENILSEFDNVINELGDDLEIIYDTFLRIRNGNSRVESESKHFNYFSVFESQQVNSWARLYVWTCSNDRVEFHFDGGLITFDLEGLYYRHNNIKSPIKALPHRLKEKLVVFYRNYGLIDFVTECLNKHLQISLKEYQSELDRQKRILENVQPITKNDTHWSDYIMYLLKWSSEHADKEFAGMSPACYDEWLDNESEE